MNGWIFILGLYCAVAFSLAYKSTVLWTLLAFILAAAYYFLLGKKNLKSEHDEFHALDILK